uniref:Histone-lysine N-methyltransferase SETMAR n=1 Tax=Acrobeloides nanus TaxID=290746 RepID=A0A914DTM5_9BILA
MPAPYRRRVVQSINDKGWNLLQHPPYSPTEAPTNYHVKNCQIGKIYNDLDELVADVKVWIASTSFTRRM